MAIFLFIGQPGSGKTTLAKAMIEACNDNCMHLDGDKLRNLFKNFDYSPAGRKKNVLDLHNFCRFLDSEGVTPVVSIVAPYREMRDPLKETNKVFEIYVHTSNVRGREKHFVKEFEVPLVNFIDIDTTDKTVAECLKLIPFNRKKELSIK